jgi:hypothetical protein
VEWMWLIVLILSPAILYGLALLFVAVYRGRFRRCQRHGLKPKLSPNCRLLTDAPGLQLCCSHRAANRDVRLHKWR